MKYRWYFVVYICNGVGLPSIAASEHNSATKGLVFPGLADFRQIVPTFSQPDGETVLFVVSLPFPSYLLTRIETGVFDPESGRREVHFVFSKKYWDFHVRQFHHHRREYMQRRHRSTYPCSSPRLVSLQKAHPASLRAHTHPAKARRSASKTRRD